MTTFEPPIGLDLAPIRARAVLADQAGMGPGALWVVRASARDVPGLCDEIEALRAHGAGLRAEGFNEAVALLQAAGLKFAVTAVRDEAKGTADDG